MTEGSESGLGGLEQNGEWSRDSCFVGFWLGHFC